MPIYNFKCAKCSYIFEALVFSVNTTKTECNKCSYLADKVFTPSYRLKIFMGLNNSDKKIRDIIKNDRRSPSSGVTFDNGKNIIG